MPRPYINHLTLKPLNFETFLLFHYFALCTFALFSYVLGSIKTRSEENIPRSSFFFVVGFGFIRASSAECLQPQPNR